MVYIRRQTPRLNCHIVTFDFFFFLSIERPRSFEHPLKTMSDSEQFKHDNPQKVQEIINYFSSRLHAATIATVNPANAEKTWLMGLLLWDLVLFFKINL